MNRLRFGMIILSLLGLSLALRADTTVVRRGDTLAKIAAREFGDAARAHELATANRLKPNAKLRAGQALILPARVPSAAVAPDTASAPAPAAPPVEAPPSAPLPEYRRPDYAFARHGVPIRLEALVAVAMEKNYSLLAGRFAPRLAEIEVKAARAVFLPQLEAKQTWGEHQLSPIVIDYPLNVEGRKSEASLAGQLPSSTRYKLTAMKEHLSVTAPQTGGFGRRIYDQNVLAISLEQPLLKGFGRAVSGQMRLNAFASEVAKRRYQRLSEQTVGRIERAYWLLAEAEDAEVLQRDAVERCRYTMQRDSVAYSRGSIARLDFALSRQNLALREADLIEARRRRLEAMEQVLLLVYGDDAVRRSRADDLALVTVRERPDPAPAMPEDAAARRAFERRSDYQAALEELARAREALGLSKNNLLPELNVQGMVGAGKLADNFSLAASQPPPLHQSPWEVNIVFRMPLGNFEARALHARAFAEEEAKRLSLNELSQGILLEVRQSVRTLEMERERLALAREAKANAEEVYRAAWEAYAVGRIDGLQLSQYEEAYEKVSLRELAARRDLANAETAYHLALGDLMNGYFQETR